MALFTWKELPGTNPSAVGADLGVAAFSGAAYDPTRRLFIFFGGGHNDSDDNGVYAVRVGLDTPDVVALMAQSASKQIDVAYYSDGKPSSRHTYGSLVYHPGADGMMPIGAAALWGQALIMGNVDRFKLSTNTWDPAGRWASLPSGAPQSGISAVVDNAGNIFATSNGSSGPKIMKWTPTAGTYYPGTWEVWTGTSLGANWWDTENALTYDPSRNRLVYFGAGSAAAWFDIATKARTAITFTGPAAGSAAGKSWSSYCPERDSFFGYEEGTSATMLECRASDFYVSTVSVAGTAPSSGGTPTPTGPYNRLKLDTNLGIVMLHNNWTNRNLFAFRYK